MAVLSSTQYDRMSKFMYEDIQSVDNPNRLEDGSGEDTDLFFSPLNSDEHRDMRQKQQSSNIKGNEDLAHGLHYQHRNNRAGDEMNRTNKYRLVPHLDLQSAAVSGSSPLRSTFQINPMPIRL